MFPRGFGVVPIGFAPIKALNLFLAAFILSFTLSKVLVTTDDIVVAKVGGGFLLVVND